jgi:phospholipid/cholesterol/gamma-HCH transport system substrate-binding protein
METRAPYAIIGLFVLAAIGAVLGFVYWLNNTGGLGERRVYRVQFDTPVTGLLVGAAVLFNGIRVGEVTELKLPQGKPKQVVATISVAVATPVKADTKAGLEFQGLTGIPVIALEGGSEDERPTGNDLVLVADPAASQSMTVAARNALVRVDGLVAENSSGVRDIVGNLKTFSDALARNSDRIDGILTGVEKMTGAGPAAPPKTIYDLVAPVFFPSVNQSSAVQLAVAEPTVTLQLDTQRILVLPASDRPPSFADVQWGDNIPKLVQARLVQAFENFSLQRAVTRTSPDISADQQLLVDIRSFQVVTTKGPVAEVTLTAKVLSKDGRVLASKIFAQQTVFNDLNPATASAAINEAFGRVAVDIVVWASGIS